MNYFEKQAKAQKNQVMACVLRICRWCMWCFEQCVRFLNKHLRQQVVVGKWLKAM